MKQAWLLILMLALFVAVGCDGDDGEDVGGDADTDTDTDADTDGDSDTDEELTPAQRLAGSLHGTARGMKHFYDIGTGTLTGVAFEDTPCADCHATTEVDETGCGKCHTLDGTDVGAVEMALCKNCHGRQKKEIALLGVDHDSDPATGNQSMDVHMGGMGFSCTSCHTKDEIHGDGVEYENMFADGAIKTTCDQSGCHENHDHVTSFHHDDDDRLHCSACHVKATVSCYSCHFQGEIDRHQKMPKMAIGNWKFLLKDTRSNQIRSGNMQSVTYNGNKVMTIAPFHGHVVYKPDSAVVCDECHANPVIAAYEADTSADIDIVQWNDTDASLSLPLAVPGEVLVVPFIEGWEDRYKFDMATITEYDTDTAGKAHTWAEEPGQDPTRAADIINYGPAEPIPTDELPPQF